jgi:signal transduction histidine kinase
MAQTKQTAKLLLSFQHDLEALLQVTPSLILVFEMDGEILAANDEATRIIHVHGEQLVGKNIFTIFQFADGSFDAQVLQVTRSQNIAAFEGIHRGRMLACTLYPILDARQKVVRIALLAQDNTDRRRAEDQVRILTQELERKVFQRTAELQRANQELRQEKRRAELLADFSKVLVEHAYNYTGLIQQISDEISRQIGDACLIVVFSGDETELQLTSVSHRSHAALEEMRTVLNNKSYPAQQVGLANFMLKREKYIGEKLSYEQVCDLIPPDLWLIVDKNGLKGLIGIPLLVHDHVLGAIFTARHRRDSIPYSPDDVAFLQSIAGPLTLAIENAQLFAETEQNRLRLRGLSQRLVKIQEEQFRRLGQELHDHIGQDLTAIHTNLNLIENMLPVDSAEGIRPHLADINRLATESMIHMRNIMSDFLPPMLERYGLPAALLWYAEKFTTHTNIPVTVNNYNLQDLRLPREIELGLFRIGQEALNNIAKHAQAAQVEIELKDDGSYILVTVTDNGVGFDLRETTTSQQNERWGLSIMQERAMAIGASFNLKSLPGKGTKVILRVSKDPLPG